MNTQLYRAILDEEFRLLRESQQVVNSMADLRDEALAEAVLLNKLNCAKLEALAWCSNQLLKNP